jgi:hypothetical protein
MSFLKLATTAVTVAMLATAASAGSLIEPASEPMVEVMADDDGGSGAWLPLVAVLALALAVGSSSSSGTTESQ